jgi:ATP-dependent protease HslVU (ClpYQ) ATPase subunit
MEAKIEAEKDLKDLTAQEHKRIRDQEKEGKKEKKEDKIKKIVEVAEVPMTERQREAAKQEEEKKEKEKQRREELKRAEFHDKEKELQELLFQSQNKVTLSNSCGDHLQFFFVSSSN